MNIIIACFPDNGITPDQLIEATNQSMYKAEGVARNQLG